MEYISPEAAPGRHSTCVLPARKKPAERPAVRNLLFCPDRNGGLGGSNA